MWHIYNKYNMYVLISLILLSSFYFCFTFYYNIYEYLLSPFIISIIFQSPLNASRLQVELTLLLLLINHMVFSNAINMFFCCCFFGKFYVGHRHEWIVRIIIHGQQIPPTNWKNFDGIENDLKMRATTRSKALMNGSM